MIDGWKVWVESHLCRFVISSYSSTFCCWHSPQRITALVSKYHTPLWSNSESYLLFRKSLILRFLFWKARLWVAATGLLWVSRSIVSIVSRRSIGSQLSASSRGGRNQDGDPPFGIILSGIVLWYYTQSVRWPTLWYWNHLILFQSVHPPRPQDHKISSNAAPFAVVVLCHIVSYIVSKHQMDVQFWPPVKKFYQSGKCLKCSEINFIIYF